jgi:hypothetical protein
MTERHQCFRRTCVFIFSPEDPTQLSILWDVRSVQKWWPQQSSAKLLSVICQKKLTFLLILPELKSVEIHKSLSWNVIFCKIDQQQNIIPCQNVNLNLTWYSCVFFTWSGIIGYLYKYEYIMTYISLLQCTFTYEHCVCIENVNSTYKLKQHANMRQRKNYSSIRHILGDTSH